MTKTVRKYTVMITLRVMGRINIDPFIENFENEIEVIIPVVVNGPNASDVSKRR